MAAKIGRGKHPERQKAVKRLSPQETAKLKTLKSLEKFLQTGPKTASEVEMHIGPGWHYYMRELAAVREIENKRVWWMK